MLIANRKGSSNNKYRISNIGKKVPIPRLPAHPLKINAPLLKAVWSRLWCWKTLLKLSGGHHTFMRFGGVALEGAQKGLGTFKIQQFSANFSNLPTLPLMPQNIHYLVMI